MRAPGRGRGGAARLGAANLVRERAWAAALLLYLGLVATLAGYIGWTRGLRRLEASRTVAYLYVVPVVAIIIGALTLGERVTVWLGAGAALVVAGMALAQ